MNSPDLSRETGFRLRFWGWFIPLVSFAALMPWRLDRPGLRISEIDVVYPMMKWLSGFDHWPMALLRYHGPNETYATLPFLFLFGNTPVAVRLGPLLAAFALLYVVHRLTLRLSENEGTAFLASYFLALSPSFLIGARFGYYTRVTQMLLGFVALTLFIRWIKDCRPRNFYLASLFLGLAAGCHIAFLWFVNMLVVTLFVTRQYPRLLPLKRLFIGGLIFIATGFGPLIYENIRNENLSTIKTLAGYLVVSKNGIHNADYPANLRVRGEQVLSLAEGSLFTFKQPSSQNRSFLWLGLALGAFLAIPFLYRKDKKRFSGAMLAWFMSAGILIQSPVTISSLSPDKLFILLPFLSMGMAYLVSDLLRRFVHPLSRSLFIGIIVCAFFFGESFRLLHSYGEYLEELPGTYQYGMADYIRTQGVTKVYMVQDRVLQRPIDTILNSFLIGPIRSELIYPEQIEEKAIFGGDKRFVLIFLHPQREKSQYLTKEMLNSGKYGKWSVTERDYYDSSGRQINHVLVLKRL
ncbi:MAG TPA: glycosyltransferase family 39 protein [Elusimicrobiota bacterium]|nr:glycosyltransferase family 39 protein [Elusimicrobiota bacterium]